MLGKGVGADNHLREKRMPTILVVEDDTAVREVIELHLSASGFDVVSAPDTVAASQHLSSISDIDLCLIDLVMPANVPDGAAFARSVRSQRPDMPVILMTGYYTAAARVSDLANTVIFKPLDLDTLVTEIGRQLVS
jgi:DNA-binding NtrC family response regulator